MGTRNLTAVMVNGEYKIAQYGQWDGYPEGQGVKILNFLSEAGNIDKLKAALSRVRFLDADGKDKAFYDEYQKNAPEWSSDPDNRTADQVRWFETYISRDIGGKILSTVADSTDPEIILRNKIDFAGDSLFCEWAYIVDLDKGTFEVYEGFNHSPVPDGERFSKTAFEKAKNGNNQYYPVKHVMTFQLNALPKEDEFIALLSKPEEPEE